MSAKEDKRTYKTQNLEYFIECEKAYVQVLVEGETFEKVAKQVNQLEGNVFPMYNTSPLRPGTGLRRKRSTSLTKEKYIVEGETFAKAILKHRSGVPGS